MAQTLSVPVAIFADSGIEEGNPADGPFARVVYKCLWTDRYQLVKDLMWSSSSSGAVITRQFGFPYAPSPNLRCVSIESIKPFGKFQIDPALGLPWLVKKKALVTAMFRVPTFGSDTSYDASGQPFTTTNLNLSAEFLTVPDSVYKFSGGVTTKTPVGIVIPQVEISFKRHWMPYLPVNAMFSLLGKVNNAVFTIGVAGQQFACPAGTLLFLGGPNDIQTDTAGNIIQELEYRMIYRPVPWNYYLHPNGTTGFAAVADGSGNPPYAPGDFTTLP